MGTFLVAVRQAGFYYYNAKLDTSSHYGLLPTSLSITKEHRCLWSISESSISECQTVWCTHGLYL